MFYVGIWCILIPCVSFSARGRVSAWVAASPLASGIPSLGDIGVGETHFVWFRTGPNGFSVAPLPVGETWFLSLNGLGFIVVCGIPD